MTMTTINLTAKTPLAELQQLVAENLWVPCPICQPLPEGPPPPICPTCSGAGRVWPMRKPCPGCMGTGYFGGQHYTDCFGWIPVTDRNRLEGAVRVKGWDYSHGNSYLGDWAYVDDGNHNQRASVLGEVKPLEKVRGDHAVWLAAARAVCSEGDTERCL